MSLLARTASFMNTKFLTRTALVTVSGVASLGLALSVGIPEAKAISFYTTSAAWGTATATLDDFNYSRPNADSITFLSGVVSTGAPVAADTRNEVQAGPGRYRGTLKYPGNNSAAVYQTISWMFPQPINGLFADWQSIGQDLRILVDFDNIADVTIDLRSKIGGPNGSFGFLETADTFSKITFSLIGDGRENNRSDVFEVDNLAYKKVPTPALLPGLFALGAGALRKRKQQTTSTIA
jgi:hypothetical protein